MCNNTSDHVNIICPALLSRKWVVEQLLLLKEGQAPWPGEEYETLARSMIHKQKKKSKRGYISDPIRKIYQTLPKPSTKHPYRHIAHAWKGMCMICTSEYSGRAPGYSQETKVIWTLSLVAVQPRGDEYHCASTMAIKFHPRLQWGVS